MHLLLPLEVGGDGELDAEEGAGDGLDVGLKFEFRELVDEAVNETTGFGLANKLTELCTRWKSPRQYDVFEVRRKERIDNAPAGSRSK
jgi:hypothetical protein